MKEIKFYQPNPTARRGWVQPAAIVLGFVLVTILAFGAGIYAQRSGWINDVLNKSSNDKVGLPDDLNYESVEELYDVLRKQYDGELSEEELLNGLKSGLAEAAGDPYTTYLDEEDAAQFEEDLNGVFVGIGAELGKENGSLIIVAPIDGFPAAEAGLLPKDKILAVDGEDATGMTIEKAISLIRGEEGTDVRLLIGRGTTQKEYVITRETITVPSVNSEVKEGNIGYIRITRFANDTASLVDKAAQELKSQNVSAVILDLRNNSGGLLRAAVDVSSLWLDGKVVVEQRQGGLTVDSVYSANNPALAGLPTIVLINPGSASASEIVAGALRDHKVATLLGETSFGKGSVQELEELFGGGLLKVTVARWYTPGGVNIDEAGLTPDVKVKLTVDDITAGRDPQLDEAIKRFKQ